MTEEAQEVSEEAQQQQEEAQSKFSGRSFGGESEPETKEAGDVEIEGKRPDNIPESFWDDEKSEVKLEALLKSHSDTKSAYDKLKREKSLGGEVPEDASEYFEDGLELSEDVDRLQVLPDDPGLKTWGEVCHKYGIGKELAVSIAKDMFTQMNEYADAPIDPEMEREALGDRADGIIEGVEVWLDNLDAGGKLSDDDAEIAMNLMQTAKGIKFLRTMRSATGERPIPHAPSQTRSGISPEQFDDMYKQAIKDGNYQERERLDGLRDQIFGGEAHNTSVNSFKQLKRAN